MRLKKVSKKRKDSNYCRDNKMKDEPVQLAGWEVGEPRRGFLIAFYKGFCITVVRSCSFTPPT